MKNNKPSWIELIVMNLATIFFVVGLIIINIAIYYLFGPYVGLLTTGFMLVLVALVMNYEQST